MGRFLAPPSDRLELEEKDKTSGMGFGPSVTCQAEDKLEIVQRKSLGKFVGYRGFGVLIKGAAVPEDEEEWEKNGRRTWDPVRSAGVPGG